MPPRDDFDAHSQLHLGNPRFGYRALIIAGPKFPLWRRTNDFLCEGERCCGQLCGSVELCEALWPQELKLRPCLQSFHGTLLRYL